MQPITDWLLVHSAWLGFPMMAMLGGTIAYILAFETSDVRWTFSQHVALIFISWFKAFFIAACIYNLQVEYKWSPPLCFVITGLLSVFGSESIKSLYNIMMRNVFKRRGLPMGRSSDAP